MVEILSSMTCHARSSERVAIYMLSSVRSNVKHALFDQRFHAIRRIVRRAVDRLAHPQQFEIPLGSGLQERLQAQGVVHLGGASAWGSSQSPKSSRPTTTGMRSWRPRMSGLASVVRMVKVSIRLPSGFLQLDQRPAKA